MMSEEVLLVGLWLVVSFVAGFMLGLREGSL